jgi:hypothetical protein
MKGHKGRLKSYLEYKLDLELCGIDTFDKDDKIRERYDQVYRRSKTGCYQTTKTTYKQKQ